MTALLVILMIAVLISLDVLVVVRRRRRRVPAPLQLNPMRAPLLPHGLFLDPAHGWVRLHSDGTLRVGIDDFLAEALGRIDEIQLPPAGSSVARGEPLMTLRVGQRRLSVPAPATGEVRSLNLEAVNCPGLVLADPYGLGWLVGIWARDQKEAIAPLQVGNGAIAHLRGEFERLLDFLTTASPASGAPALVMAGRGLPLRGAVSALSDQGWAAFQEQFLGLAGGSPGEARRNAGRLVQMRGL